MKNYLKFIGISIIWYIVALSLNLIFRTIKVPGEFLFISGFLFYHHYKNKSWFIK
jgi:hypothetical protein